MYLWLLEWKFNKKAQEINISSIDSYFHFFFYLWCFSTNDLITNFIPIISQSVAEASTGSSPDDISSKKPQVYTKSLCSLKHSTIEFLSSDIPLDERPSQKKGPVPKDLREHYVE